MVSTLCARLLAQVADRLVDGHVGPHAARSAGSSGRRPRPPRRRAARSPPCGSASSSSASSPRAGLESAPPGSGRRRRRGAAGAPTSAGPPAAGPEDQQLVGGRQAQRTAPRPRRAAGARSPRPGRPATAPARRRGARPPRVPPWPGWVRLSRRTWRARGPGGHTTIPNLCAPRATALAARPRRRVSGADRTPARSGRDRCNPRARDQCASVSRPRPTPGECSGGPWRPTRARRRRSRPAPTPRRT